VTERLQENHFRRYAHRQCPRASRYCAKCSHWIAISGDSWPERGAHVSTDGQIFMPPPQETGNRLPRCRE
jgi:hypothetical protein